MSRNIYIQGLQAVRSKYQNVADEAQDHFGDFLDDIVKDSIISSIEGNFRSQGSDKGKWAKLAPMTVKERIFLGYKGNSPILRRTGSLFKEVTSDNSFSIERKGHNVSLIYKLKSNRAIELQEGNSSAKLPARPFADLNKRNKAEVMRDARGSLANLFRRR